MKKFSKIIAVLLVLVMALSFLPAAFAAGGVEVEAGKQATVSFAFTNVYGVDGEFTFSNPGMFSSVTYTYAGSVSGMMANNKAIFSHYEPFAVTLVVNCTVAAGAKAGDTCDISFTYETADKDGNMSAWSTATKTVVVKAAAAPQPTPTPAPTVKIDYSELNRQLDIAAGLNGKDYTAESWAALTDALNAGKAALSSTSQSTVDAAAKALAAAIANLVRMDYSKLQAALDSVKDLGKDAGVGDLIDRLVAAIDAGKDALNGNDQAAVDAAAKELEEVIAALRKALDELKVTETIVEKVPVEVEPTSPFCNISWHNLLLILLIISVVLNVVFIVILVATAMKKKKNRKDTTPLVNYNIADDE